MKNYKECVHTVRFDRAGLKTPKMVLDNFRKLIAKHHPGLDQKLDIERIEFGDPDGLGDLMRSNEFALRTRVKVYA